MTRYDELSDALFEFEPKLAAINETFRTLPPKLRTAIQDGLGVPTGQMMTTPGISWGRVVELVAPLDDGDGGVSWKACEPGNYLTPDSDGVMLFTIGVFACRNAQSLPTQLRLRIFIESVTPEAVELRVDNLDGKFIVNLIAEDGYARAADAIIERIIGWLREGPSVTRKQLGFDVASAAAGTESPASAA